MKSTIPAILSVLMLAGCGAQTGNEAAGSDSNMAANATDNMTAPAVASNEMPAAENAAAPVDTAADEAALRETVTKFYASYNKPDGPDLKLSRAFDAAWQRAVGKDGALDADPFCGCQDFDKVSSKVRSVKLDGDHARVALTVINFGQQSKNELGFVREGGAWLIDDIFDEKGRSIKKAMNDSEPGSWDIGAQ